MKDKKDSLIVKKEKTYEIALLQKERSGMELQNRQKIIEIKEKIKNSINSNNPIFIKTLKMFLSEE